jgi:hypothetical protein
MMLNPARNFLILTCHGIKGEVKHENGKLVINGNAIEVFAERVRGLSLKNAVWLVPKRKV